MGMAAIRETRRGRGIALATAVATAAVLAAPSAADAWPMAGQNGENTRQANTTGPSDPGLAWFRDVTDLDDYSFPIQIGAGADNAPVVSTDGTVIRRASHDDRGTVLVALDGDDGSFAWEIDGVGTRCTPSIDSQDRLWVLVTGNADEDLDGPALQAFDPDSGDVIAGAVLELDALPSGTNCGRSSLHIGGDGALERLILVPDRGDSEFAAYDISTAGAPSLAWSVGMDANDDAPFDGTMRRLDERRVGAFSGTAFLLPVHIGDDFELIAFDLTDGSVDGRQQMPVFDGDGDEVTISPTNVDGRIMVVGDEAVYGLNQRAGGGTSVLHGVDLDSFEILWTELLAPRNTTSGSGPTKMALSENTVVYNNDGTAGMFGYDLTTRAATSWSGDIPARVNDIDLLTDVDGGIYTISGSGNEMRINRTTSNGTLDWAIPDAALEAATGEATGNRSAGSRVRLGAISQDGTLVLYSEGRTYAIDSSSGLAEEQQCQLPFTDVGANSTHAVNICRLVKLEVTGGLTETTYGPRQPVTRAQMATFLTRALDLPAGSGQQFPDVDASSVHAPNILSIRDAGITEGRADGTYDPGGQLTRAEMATFLARAAELDSVTDGSGFNDVDPGNVHTPSIYAVRDADITTGRTATTYDPTGTVQRDQMASFLIRMIDFLDEG